MRLSLADTNSMKGVVIIFIVFHNLFVYKNTINSSDFFLVMLYFAVSVLLAIGYSRIYSLAYEKLSVIGKLGT